jgi:hypothetical protein
MENFPPNSKKAQEGAREAPPRVERVTSGEAKRRRKPLGKQFKSVFFGGDAKSAGEYVFLHVLIPAIQDMIIDAGQTIVERVVRGETKTRRRGPVHGGQGYVSYNQQFNRPPDIEGRARPISRRARARHDFDDIVLSSRAEAEEVIDRLFDLINRF